MPWREISVMDQKEEFVLRALAEDMPFTMLCREYGIARRTGYKWKRRFLNEGRSGLIDRSRRPDSSPSALSEETIIRIIRIRSSHPSWGAKKIARIIEGNTQSQDTPSVASVYRILDKANLLKRKRSYKVRELHKENLHNLIEPSKPNDVWTIDYKGWWMSEDIKRCNPLTIRDLKSRYTLAVRLTPKQDTQSVADTLEHVFSEYGLPRVIRSDNGPPFATQNSPLGINRLGAMWMALGIIPDRIAPGRPYQNGSHERMHRDIKEEVQKRNRGDIRYFQDILDEWRYDYNFKRPHEALGMVTPATCYTPSPRKFKGYTEEVYYPLNLERRKVSKNGCIKWDNEIIRISSAFGGYHVGLGYEDEYTLKVWFSDFLIGKIDLVSSSFYTVSNR